MGRMRVATVALAALALVVAGCASTTDGHGTFARAAVSVHPPAPAVPHSAGLPGVLAARLMTPPAGSVPFNSAWARNHTPTVAQFTAWDYGPTNAARETARLEAEGLARIAHEMWVAPDSDQADMVLLQFNDPTGALSRFLGATTAEADAAGVRPFAVPPVAGALGYYHTALDSVGNIRAVLYATAGDTVVEEFYFSPARLRPADAIAWLAEQVKLLR